MFSSINKKSTIIKSDHSRIKDTCHYNLFSFISSKCLTLSFTASFTIFSLSIMY